MLRIRGQSLDTAGGLGDLGFGFSDIVGGGAFVVGKIVDLPGDVLDRITGLVDDLYDRFRDFTGDFADALKDGFGEVLDGIKVLARVALEQFVIACEIFRRFKDEINVGVQVAQGDYASAALNAARIAAEQLGIDVPLPRNEAPAVRAAEFVCQAVDVLEAISVEIGDDFPVAGELETREQFLLRVTRSQALLTREPSRFSDPDRPVADPTTGGTLPTPRKSFAPTVVVGGGLVAAALLFR